MRYGMSSFGKKKTCTTLLYRSFGDPSRKDFINSLFLLFKALIFPTTAAPLGMLNHFVSMIKCQCWQLLT